MIMLNIKIVKMSIKNNIKDYISFKNFVGSGKLPIEIDTDVLKESIDEELTDGKEFTWNDDSGNQPGLYYDIDDGEGPQITFHRSGSIIIRADTEELLYETKEQLVKDGIKIGLIPKEKKDEDIEFEIQNIVALFEIGEDLPIYDLSEDLGIDAQYEPEQFPAIIYGTNRYSCTFLIYKNGKIIIAGADSKEEVYDSAKKLYEELEIWIT